MCPFVPLSVYELLNGQQEQNKHNCQLDRSYSRLTREEVTVQGHSVMVTKDQVCAAPKAMLFTMACRALGGSGSSGEAGTLQAGWCGEGVTRPGPEPASGCGSRVSRGQRMGEWAAGPG